MLWLIPLILGALSLGVFLFFRVRGQRVIAVIIKGFISLMFITTALVALLSSHNPENYFWIFVIIGLFFGLLGDIFLDLKYIILEKAMMYTILGFIAFAIGHIFYVTGLFVYLYDFNSSILYIIIPIIVALLLSVVTLLMEKFTPIRYQSMKVWVIVYGLCLFFDVALYFAVCIQSGWNNPLLIMFAVGVISFMASDLILNNTYFATGFDGPVFIISNHILYYVGQFLIALSLLYLL